ncbi:hypothetical protein HPB47_017050 [Ixodes persulcatus]|uniref:Uncharacterized protein n=1 Tax=Ixodes persulcatus TaxID=34615 RepID=A0AC60QPC3_IXOPE|nr:hypothetical protein HPB47_017050 [Ixodes persulcatus]
MKLVRMAKLEVSARRAVNDDRVNTSSDGFSVPSAVVEEELIAPLTPGVPSMPTLVVPPEIAGPSARLPPAATSGSASSSTHLRTHFLILENVAPLMATLKLLDLINVNQWSTISKNQAVVKASERQQILALTGSAVFHAVRVAATHAAACRIQPIDNEALGLLEDSSAVVEYEEFADDPNRVRLGGVVELGERTLTRRGQSTVLDRESSLNLHPVIKRFLDKGYVIPQIVINNPKNPPPQHPTPPPPPPIPPPPPTPPHHQSTASSSNNNNANDAATAQSDAPPFSRSLQTPDVRSSPSPIPSSASSSPLRAKPTSKSYVVLDEYNEDEEEDPSFEEEEEDEENASSDLLFTPVHHGRKRRQPQAAAKRRVRHATSSSETSSPAPTPKRPEKQKQPTEKDQVVVGGEEEDGEALFTRDEYNLLNDVHPNLAAAATHHPPMESPAAAAIETPRYSGVTPFHVTEYDFELSETNAEKIENIRDNYRDVLGPMCKEALNHYTVNQSFAMNLEKAFEVMTPVQQREFLYKAHVATKRIAKTDRTFRDATDFITFVIRRNDYKLLNVVLADTKTDVDCYEDPDRVTKQIAKRQWRVNFHAKNGREPNLFEELGRDREISFNESRSTVDYYSDNYDGGPSYIQL